jgi:uncharacterized protein (TIGR03067 family)
MHTRILVGVAVVLVSVASLAGQTQEIQDKTNEMLKLQGTWVMESATFKGKPFPQVGTNMKLVFAKDKVTMLRKGEDGKDRGEPTSYELDLKKERNVLTTRTISVSSTGEKSLTAQHAVYEVKGYVLLIYAGPPNQPPPASLKEAAEQWPLLRFKRVQK